MKVKKWIIVHDEMIIGLENYDEEISIESNEVKGGGEFYVDEKSKKVYFYGFSNKYGQCTIDDIRGIYTNGFFSPTLGDLKWMFSKSYVSNMAVEDATEI